jgi:hypothetical protein
MEDPSQQSRWRMSGILRVLQALTLGPVFITEIAANDMIYWFSNHLHNNWYPQQDLSSDVSPLTAKWPVLELAK